MPALQIVAPDRLTLEFDTSDRLSVEELRQLILQEVLEWHPELMKANAGGKASTRGNSAYGSGNEASGSKRKATA